MKDGDNNMDLQINCTADGVQSYPLHTHENQEIMLYLEGDGTMRTDVGEFPFQPGTIILMPPRIRHGSCSKTGFKNISVCGDFGRYLHFDKVTVLLDNEAQHGKSLAQMIFDNRYGNSAYLKALCDSYLLFLMQRIEIENTIHHSVEAIIFELSERAFDSELNLSQVLAKSGYSEDYIRSHFKKITKKTPTEFLTDIRIRHARFLIDIYGQALSLSEIANCCGYLDYVYFSKQFKKVVGVSPREYRK